MLFLVFLCHNKSIWFSVTFLPEMGWKILESEGVFVYKCVANNSLVVEYSMGVAVTVNGKQKSPNYVCLRTI